MKRFLTFVLLAMACPTLRATETRVAILGDSITYHGRWPTLVESALRATPQFVDAEIVNFGLPSENVSGLTEAGHAGGRFPRPNLQERLERVLEGFKPTLVLACYGMNDGIYLPLDETRFKAFRDGMIQLKAAVEKRGARIIFITPPLFNADQPAADAKNYDAVLDAQARWLVARRSDRWQVVDIRPDLKKSVADAKRANPAFIYAADGVHPGNEGHDFIAGAVCKQLWPILRLPGAPRFAEGEALSILARRNGLLKLAWLTQTHHTRPEIPAGLLLDPTNQLAAELLEKFSAATAKTSAVTLSPNIVVIMADDLGFSDIGCYGGEIQTPHLDALARNGLRFSEFKNTSRCCPSRASLLTGKYSHTVGMGWMTAADERREAYRGQLSAVHPTLPELLKAGGYTTAMVGKWHLTLDGTWGNPNGSWPTQRGFDHFYGTLSGGSDHWKPKSLVRDLTPIPVEVLPKDYYYTTAVTRAAVGIIQRQPAGKPLFLYGAYYAPHRPLQAPADRVDACMKRYEPGYDVLRQARFERQIGSDILPRDSVFGKTFTDQPWTSLSPARQQAWIKEKATYAAMVEIMDDGVGEIVAALRAKGMLDNTLFLFLSDNGATQEDGLIVQLGADLSNSPYIHYKGFPCEGGVASPLILHWPARFAAEKGTFRRDLTHIMDITPTCLDAAGISYPATFQGQSLTPAEGVSFLRPVAERTLYWEHDGHYAVRDAGWKLVSLAPHAQPWLFNLAQDPFEQHDLAAAEPEKVKTLQAKWNAWAEAHHVFPLEQNGWGARIKKYGQPDRPKPNP